MASKQSEAVHPGGRGRDTARRQPQLERRALYAGVEVRLDVFPEQLHTFQMAAGRAPEADDAIRRFADWVRPRLGLTGGDYYIRRPSVVHPAQLNDVLDPRGGTR
jgi:hypothetical protein